jgi:hypothetical protein
MMRGKASRAGRIGGTRQDSMNKPDASRFGVRLGMSNARYYWAILALAGFVGYWQK